MSAALWIADGAVSASDAAVAPTFTSPEPRERVDGVLDIAAEVGDAWSETTFAWRALGGEWKVLGTATGPSPRVVHDTRGLASGTQLEYRAITVDAAGHRAASSVVVHVE